MFHCYVGLPEVYNYTLMKRNSIEKLEIHVLNVAGCSVGNPNLTFHLLRLNPGKKDADQTQNSMHSSVNKSG